MHWSYIFPALTHRFVIVAAKLVGMGVLLGLVPSWFHDIIGLGYSLPPVWYQATTLTNLGVYHQLDHNEYTTVKVE